MPHAAADPQISGQQAAAQIIAAAIVNKDGLMPTLTAQQSQQILTGFGNAGFLQINGVNGNAALAGQATMAVVVLPATVPPAKTAVPFNLALISFTQDLQEASKGALLAGSLKGSGPRSAIDAVIGGSAGVALTTVDNAETVDRPDHRRPGTAGTAEPASDPGGLRSSSTQRRAESGSQPARVAVSEPVAVQEEVEEVTARRSVPRLLLAASAARLAYAALSRAQPGGEKTWTRTNHRGEPVTLLEGPAVTIAAAAAAIAVPGLEPPAAGRARTGRGRLGRLRLLRRPGRERRPARLPRPSRRAGQGRGHHRRGQAGRDRGHRPGGQPAARLR